MKITLIIPMGGKGKRFLNAGYKTFKPFLPVSSKKNIISNIIDNFYQKNLKIILIGDKKKIIKNKLDSRVKIINIKSHNKGPLYTLYLAKDKIRELAQKDKIFICYSDINWKWEYNEIKNYIKNKDVVIFSHKNFHPHLEVDSNSDFCLTKKKNLIKSISQKKTHFLDYKKENLAIGCYFFKNFDLIDSTLKKINFSFKTSLKKELYLVTLIKIILKEKINIHSKEIKKFVHLGNPEQYNDFLNWKKNFNKYLIKSNKFSNPNIMLMNGVGKRVKRLNRRKPFLKIQNLAAYKYIFKKFGTKNNIIITNSSISRNINKKKYLIYKIKKTKSMFSSLEKSQFFLEKYKSFFLTSCDCFGGIDRLKFKKYLKIKNPDVVIFGYFFSFLQKHLFNSHTELILNKSKLLKINVKSNYLDSKIGHAGFFWIKNKNIFLNLKKFKLFAKNNIKKREIIVDDYFSFLLDRKLASVGFYQLDYYVHFGSELEYLEYKYWENYFK